MTSAVCPLGPVAILRGVSARSTDHVAASRAMAAEISRGLGYRMSGSWFHDQQPPAWAQRVRG
ncbi:hypothetical protein F4560_001100 [Saccharothrix ecbatanensis]|uniref:Uncharacterized protein n=1 Tax=Saccharothrix ecbatanensis TaxID=1105145 RepID=A0A7W9HFJ6_9PSEU|nr:hypothetical protein [Saccharothrix ecbatanensis]MBB5801332.1 hypothetical protein [Saccharothrix ecbatanensis]